LLKDAAGAPILRYVVETPLELAGPTWEVIAFNNGQQAVVSVLLDTQITAVFGADGSLSGSAGCNQYVSAYTTDGEAITISLPSTTFMACAEPEGIMEQEAAYLAALTMAATYAIDGTTLTLFTADQAIVANFQAIEAPADTASASQEAAPGETVVAETPATGELTVPAAPPLSAEVSTALANAAYLPTPLNGESVQLVDGTYSAPVEADSAAVVSTSLTGMAAPGTLSDGREVVAVILATNTGGTGVFYDLAMMQQQDGQWINFATTFLGDRIRVNALGIANDEVVLDMVVHGPEDALCCPTEQVIQRYLVEGDTLVDMGSEALGTVTAEALPAANITGVPWKWQSMTTPLEQIQVDDPEAYVVQFTAEGLVEVQADCNTGSGQYMMSGSELTIEITATTLALCPEGSLSDQFIRSLNAAAQYSSDGNGLTIELVADGGTMQFAP
jgi:heat shock protein HslJ